MDAVKIPGGGMAARGRLLINHTRADVDFFYPRWLLCLTPIAKLDGAAE